VLIRLGGTESSGADGTSEPRGFLWKP
jgi:hypothetical protein